MAPLVIRRRPVAVSLATLPAVGIAALAQVLQQGPRGVPLLVTGALLAGCAVLVGRLLRARVRLDDTGMSVRGVLVDLRVPYAAVDQVTVTPAPAWARWLLWGLIDAQAVTLRLSGGRSVAPVALWAAAGDPLVERVIGTVRVRLPLAVVPRQRDGQRAGADASTSST